MPISAPNI